MGLKPGYKQTDIGVIPEDWRAEYLNRCVRSDAPICYGILMPGEHCAHGVPVVKVRDILDGRIKESNLLLTHPSIDEMYKRSRLRNGDILITIRGTTGRVAIVTKELEGANITQDTARLRINPKESNKFVYYALQSPPVQQQIALHTIGQAVKGINIGDVKNLVIPLPETFVEQCAISDALSDLDELLDGLDRLIAKKRNLKRGAMHKLLTREKRLPGFNEEWKPSLMSDYFDPVTTRNEELNNNVVTISAQQGFVRQEEFFKKRVASNVLSNYYLLERGQFAYNRSYSNGYPFGAVKLLNKFDKAVVTTLYICFRPKPGADVCLPFFEQYFEAGLLNDGLASVANEGGRAHGLLNVTKADFFSRPVKVPDFDEQTAIAAVLSDMDEEIAALDAKLDKARRVKQGMMHNLLTGSIRLV